MIADIVSETRLKSVYPDISSRWILVREKMWDTHQIQIRVTDGYRDFQNQWALYAEGRKKDVKRNWIVTDPKKIVTHAKAGESFHNFGLALDSAFMGDDAYLTNLPRFESENLWNEFGRISKDFGFEWGGDWTGSKNDRPHCERTYGLSLSSAQMAFEANGIKGVFDKCTQMMNCGRAVAYN